MLSRLLKGKKKPKAKLLPGSPKANRTKRKAYILQILRMTSIPTLRDLSLHLNGRITQRMGALITKDEQI